MKTDAQILEEMRDMQLENHFSSSDDYDICFEKVDNECAEALQEIIEIVKRNSDKYKIDELRILKDMIYPTLEAGVQ